MRMKVTGLFLGLWLVAASQTNARPLHYQLDQHQSVVGFEVSLGQGPMKGRMPITDATLTLDFERASASKVAVTLSPAGAEMGLPFATEAMKSPEVLDTRRFPDIRFDSTSVAADGDGARIDGLITIRGVTRPVTLAARIYRPKGTAPGARAELSVHLTGAVSRRDFGAGGFADLVGDRVTLDIIAHIRLTD